MSALSRRMPGWSTFVAAMSCVGSAWAQTASPAPGVPLELARERARLIRELRYDLTLSIPADKSAPIVGRSVVRFKWAEQASRWCSTSTPIARAPSTSAATASRFAPRRQRSSSDPGVRSARRREHGRDRLRRRRRAAQPQRRPAVHGVRASPCQTCAAVLRPARSQGALDTDARASRGVAVGRQRRRARPAQRAATAFACASPRRGRSRPTSWRSPPAR